MTIRNILRIFGIFYDRLVHSVFIWYIFSAFGTMHQEKSGSPVLKQKRRRRRSCLDDQNTLGGGSLRSAAAGQETFQKKMATTKIVSNR
jgi:hypothetical protein